MPFRFCAVSKTLFVLVTLVGLSGLFSYLFGKTDAALGNVLQSSAVLLAAIAAFRVFLFDWKLGRKVWTNSFVLFLGLALTFLGYASYGILEAILPEMPALTIADAFWIPGYLLVALFLFREFSPFFEAHAGGNTALKKAIFLIAVWGVALAILLPILPDLKASDWDMLSKALTASYVIIDVLIISLVAGLLLYTRGGSLFWTNLGVFFAFLIIVISDVFYYHGILHESYSTGNIEDLGWILGYLLIALSKTFRLKILKGA